MLKVKNHSEEAFAFAKAMVINMFIEERHRAILELLAEKGSINTAEIQRKFCVGYDSAKRDLRILEEKGLLKRTHGGAISIDRVKLGQPMRQTARESSGGSPSSLAIAQYAASLIADCDVVFIDSSAMGQLMAKSLPRELRLQVVTSSITVAAELRTERNVKLILLGGELDGQGCCRDGFALEMIRRLRFDKCFLTTDAVSAGFGLSVRSVSELLFLNTLMDSSKKIIGLYPSEKVGAESAVSVSSAARLSCLITDRMADDEAIAELGELGVKTVTVDEPALPDIE